MTAESVMLARRHARATGLIYVSDAEPGIWRRRCGEGFCYIGPDRRRITSRRTLERIRQLAIPPAYDDVWICPRAQGHLQATGRDARRRKQYRYHQQWRLTRDAHKFSRMIDFAAALPALRRRLRTDLALAGLPRQKVLAVLVSLLDSTLLRIGNEAYARTNKSYGLTTLHAQHVKFLGDGRAFFCFRGKSGQRQEVVLDDRRLARLVKRCQQLPGQKLFQYLDDDGEQQPVDSGMVNEYLREVMGPAIGRAAPAGLGFTAKDFRTWGATLQAISFLATQECQQSISQRAFNRCVAATAAHVAATLGNTAAVCRRSYINPEVFSLWREGELHAVLANKVPTGRALERQALQLLRQAAARRARTRSLAAR
jgi:DNA topoisomerase I